MNAQSILDPADQVPRGATGYSHQNSEKIDPWVRNDYSEDILGSNTHDDKYFDQPVSSELSQRIESNFSNEDSYSQTLDNEANTGVLF
jgi:hypothetical protein